MTEADVEFFNFGMIEADVEFFKFGKKKPKAKPRPVEPLSTTTSSSSSSTPVFPSNVPQYICCYCKREFNTPRRAFVFAPSSDVKISCTDCTTPQQQRINKI